MIEQRVVKSCPVVRQTEGKIQLTPEVVAQLCGLMHEEKGMEWAALGHGRVERGGEVLVVERLSIPGQSRGPAYVQVEEHDQEEGIVCVFHSHHSMGAFFSGTDHTKLNPLYRGSVVLAEIGSRDRKVRDRGKRELNLGWEYEAQIRFKLPCGEVGQARAVVQVGDQSFPEIREEVGLLHEHLGDCPSEMRKEGEQVLTEEDGYGREIRPECGKVAPVIVPVVAAWGVDTSLVEELRKVDRSPRLGHDEVWSARDREWEGWDERLSDRGRTRGDFFERVDDFRPGLYGEELRKFERWVREQVTRTGDAESASEWLNELDMQYPELAVVLLLHLLGPARGEWASQVMREDLVRLMDWVEGGQVDVN